MCSAKPIQFEEVRKMPVVNFQNADKAMAKDVWIVEEENDEVFILTLCKSTTDEHLNASSTSYVVPDEDEPDKFLLNTTNSKIMA